MSGKSKSRIHINWHEAATCAFQIELHDYSDFLEYLTEYVLGKNSYRIDLLIIKKLTDIDIPKNIAQVFRTFNLLEIKGIGSSVSIDSYYKTIGYAGLFINQTGRRNQYSGLDISLTLLSSHYPRKLMKHLLRERDLRVAKPFPGVYYINKETFTTQIIVTKELSSKDNLYLRCLTNHLEDSRLANRLAKDYGLHQEDELYTRYMQQITTANLKRKGDDSPMVCEGILNLCGTSSAEIIERTRKEDAEYYQPKLNQQASQIDYLKSLLKKNNIPFQLDADSDNG